MTNGASYGTFRPMVTSYDFDAPISDSGKLTEKYYAIRKVIAKVSLTMQMVNTLLIETN